jgi:SAM-dependent methyltransferase
MEDYNCINCNSVSHESIYKGKIRSGTFGKMSNEDYEVMACGKCSLCRLYPFPEINYETAEYRFDFNGSSDAFDYLEMHDHEQNPRISKIGIENFRNKIVLDYGCGGGSFLDAIKGVSQKTIGVEPFTGFHESLVSRGHEVFPNIEEALLKYHGEIDVVISFGVIEHTLDPLAYLKNSFDLLKKQGSVYLETDNLNDFLMTSDLPEFKMFFYRTVHYWYFDSHSLLNTFELAGFSQIIPGFRHCYDLSNAMLWMRDRRPSGIGGIAGIHSSCNQSWISFLQESGQSDLLFFSALKD